MSQDNQSSVLDVQWKWEEQCPIAKAITKTKPRRIEPAYNRKPKKAILRESPECVQKKGFYKFREELLRNVINVVNQAPFEKSEEYELDSSLKENYDLLQINNIAIVKETEKICNDTPKSELVEIPKPKQETNLFDDSELPDYLLFECSQLAEEAYHNKVKRKKIVNDIAFDHVDSFDELLRSIPIDENCIQSPSDIGKQPSTSKYSSPDNPPQCRNLLNHHDSTPTNADVSDCISNWPTISFNGHHSLQMNDNGTEKISRLSSSSSESEAEKRRCTAEEIKRKQLEAIQRRQASKLKVPADDNCIQKPPDVGKQPSIYPSANLPQCRSPLIRHHSMPTNSYISKCVSNVATISALNLAGSSSESAEAENFRCTAEEIERKRLEAFKRRQSSKQKVPANENFIQKSPDIGKQPSTSIYSNPSKCRSPLIRHHSMPTNVATISLSRQNNRPIYDNGTGLNLELTSSSSESAETEKRRCTAEEIKRKHLEAIQRRQARKQNVPANERFIQKSPDIGKQSSTAIYCNSSSPPKCRSPLIRHNSMPTNVSRVSLSRQNNGIVLNSVLPSSSSESAAEAVKRRFTADEIKQKRLEAIQRREASKQKKASQSAMTTRNSLLNKNNM